MDKNDITSSLISENEIRSKMGRIFPDAVILNKHFKIVTVSKDICEALGYKEEELCGLSVSHITDTSDLQELLEEKLKPGFFEEYQIEIQTKQGHKQLFSVSGYYLGLIANIDDLIILKFKNLNEVRFIYNLLEAKTLELDEFIYHTSHRLRGPLATLLGLINLVGKSTNKNELDFFISQMNVYAQRLDDILHKLIYFAESDKAQTFSADKITLSSIGEKLRLYAEEQRMIQSIKFREFLPEPMLLIDNGELVFTLLQSIESFFCQQLRSFNSELYFSGFSNRTFFEFVLSIKEIELTEKLKKKIETVNFGYVEILNEPEFTGLYVAKKIVLKLKGNIRFNILEPNEVSVLITIPKCLP